MLERLENRLRWLRLGEHSPQTLGSNASCRAGEIQANFKKMRKSDERAELEGGMK